VVPLAEDGAVHEARNTPFAARHVPVPGIDRSGYAPHRDRVRTRHRPRYVGDPEDVR